MENDKKYKLHTPDGVHDFLLDECFLKKNIEWNLRTRFRNAMYQEIETPSIEYLDVFTSGDSALPQEMMYKFSDDHGRMLCLRPDLTVPTARFYATKLRDAKLPVKLFYIGNVFRSNEAGGGRTKEFTQAGIEYIGTTEPSADAEVISQAIMSVKESGIDEFQIDLGHVDFFRGVIEEAGIDENSAEQIRLLVDEKNFAELELLIAEKDIPDNLKELLTKIPTLFGEDDILDSAGRLCNNKRSLDALANIREVMDILEQRGLKEYITIDLGLTSSLKYYTGTIFKGFIKGLGFPILSGGRYDRLLCTFGTQEPAVGFCLGVNMLMQAVLRKENSGEKVHDEYLNVALSKGRLAECAIVLFEKAGIHAEELKTDTRKLIITDEENKIRFFLVKPSDVPTYVEYGAADIGIVGRDTILEENRNLYQIRTLDFGKCRMCVCGRPELAGKLDSMPNKRVATKYPSITKDYYEKVKKESVEIIKLNGSVELAPLVGLSDVIVDIVESGRTLRENGLDVLETVADLSARIIVNKVSMKTQRERIKSILL
ncbi:MAG: ATP phosphoribosyltransferase regulatory subunit [Ruminococcaceae bacterium]|nr:ATP phosphoribosyltransferase regulatory subunit [Oscillospiraceae bacterium]